MPCGHRQHALLPAAGAVGGPLARGARCVPISVGGRSRLALLTLLAVLLTTALLATTGVRPAAAGTGEVVSAGAAAIPGSYIVALKTPAAPPAAPAGVSSSLRAAREL